ncbi:kelch-like protein 10 [Centropristis striata]|uniref:kelch-like protein 10 n=1 Tax=Centropristis striata TaxID=184440 RepID=UPI0027E073F2|nr:kelch-like protein 10 [Centropristis striata]
MMHLIIGYAYSQSLPLTEENVVEVLAAADQFLVSGMVQACSLFLEDQMCLRNCVHIWRLLDFYSLPELRNKVFLYILKHFEEIVFSTQDLLELSLQQLAAILENDHLNVRREDVVFEAVLRWINHQPDQRRGHISELLPKVRLGLLNADYLKNCVMDNVLVKNSIECVPIINDAVTGFLDSRSGTSNSASSNHLNRPRLPSSILLVSGGSERSSFRVYDARADHWVTVSAGGVRRTHHGAAALNSLVYFIGGCTAERYLNTVQKFDLATGSCHQVAPLNCCRSALSAVVLNGCIYAIGGYNAHVYCDTVECYKPETDCWTMVAPMHSRRCSASATTLNDKVYIFGGFNGHHSLSSAECYDPRTNLWTLIAPMRSCRSGLGVAASRGRIYAVGGMIHETCHLSTVEVYNPQTNRWHRAPSMSAPRSHFGIEVVDDQILVVGGYNGYTDVLTVERYDEEAGLWYRASSIETPQNSLICCVLHGLTGLVENLFPRGSPTFPNAAGTI